MLQPTLAASTAFPAGPLPPGILVEGQYARKANAQWYRGMVLRCCNAVELGTGERLPVQEGQGWACWRLGGTANLLVSARPR